MNWLNLIKMAFRALSNNKMRGFLTMLGVIIGVASVIAMLAIGQGSKRSIREQIADMGSNLVMVQAGNRQLGGVRMSSTDMQTLKFDDYLAVQNEADKISEVSPVVSARGQLINGANNAPGQIVGVNTNYLNIRRYELERGNMFTDKDIRSAAKVCVVGVTVVNNLFPDGDDPVGKVIRFNKIPFRIFGVLKSKGYNAMGQDQDDVVLAPYTTVQKRILAINYLHSIYISAASEQSTDEVISSIQDILRRRHNIATGADDDFTVRSQKEISNILNKTSDLLTILLASIAGISLLVGGIGIMNIMYVSVTERTREIGLRMSIGAKAKHILMQFLIEAIIISVTGGLIGVLIGVGISFLIKMTLNWPVYIQLYSVILSFGVCTLTGIFFGWYPAKKASQLNPIDAIRYE